MNNQRNMTRAVVTVVLFMAGMSALLILIGATL